MDEHQFPTMIIRSFLALIALAAPLAASDLQPSQIPASAKWLIHADVDSMRDSETGKAVFQLIAKKHAQQIEDVARLLAFRLPDHLKGVTLHGDGAPGNAVLLLNGIFNRVYIETIIQGAEAYSSSTHGDSTIHTWTDKGSVQHASFAGDQLLVFSRALDPLKHSLDVLKGTSPATEDPLFTADDNRTLAIGAIRISGIQLPGDAARLLSKADSLRIAASETDGRFNLRVAAKALQNEESQRLLRLLDGAIAFGQLAVPELSSLDLRMKVAEFTNGEGFSTDINLPTGEWLEFLRAAANEASGILGN